MRACGYEGADPLVEEAPKDFREARGKRTLARRQRRVDILQQLYDAHLADASGRAGITEDQFWAGRLFQSDCERAELRAASSGDLVACGRGASLGLSDAKLFALSRAGKAVQRVHAALGYLGPDASRFAVCVLLGRASPSFAAGAIDGWQRDMGLPALRLLLTVLSRFYLDRLTDCA